MHRLRSDQAVALRSTGQPRAAVPTWSEVAVPILFVIVVLAGLSVALCAQAGDPTAPTAAQDPLTIDRAWQKASAKYDAARTAILKDVDRVNAGGRFRADWESLQSYKVPDWYMGCELRDFLHQSGQVNEGDGEAQVSHFSHAHIG